jgi:hypothetical protein
MKGREFPEQLNGKDRLVDGGVYGRIILKCILEK